VQPEPKPPLEPRLPARQVGRQRRRRNRQQNVHGAAAGRDSVAPLLRVRCGVVASGGMVTRAVGKSVGLGRALAFLERQ
jgi:hypothetical protein